MWGLRTQSLKKWELKLENEAWIYKSKVQKCEAQKHGSEIWKNET